MDHTGPAAGLKTLPYRLSLTDETPLSVRARLVRAYHRNTPLPILTVHVAAGAFVLALQWGYVPRPWLLLWGLALLAAVLATAVALHRYAADANADAHPDRWAVVFLMTSLGVGIAWGSAGFLFYTPERPLESMFLALIIAGMTAGGASTKSSLVGCAVALVGAQTGLLGLRAILIGDPGHLGFAMLLAVFAGGVLTFIRANHQVLLDSARLVEDNEALLERAMRSDLQFRTLVDNVSDLIAVVDGEGVLRFHSPSSERLLGWKPGELVGRSLRDLVHPEDCPPLIDDLTRLLDEPQRIASRAVRVRHQDGTWRVMTVHARFLPPGQGGRKRIVLSAQDITEERQVQDALKLAMARAEEAARAKSEFLATMSHEIRTPMAGIIGLIDLLKATGLSDKQREYVRALDRAGEHLADLLDDILDFSKIEAGKMEPEDAVFDLRKAVSGVLDIFRSTAEAKGVHLQASVAPHLSRLWRGDARHIRQVLVNLIGNAVKFTAEGHVTLRVEEDPEWEPRTGEADGAPVPILFTVEDSGIGIRPENIAHIFDPFGQGDATSTRRYGGTGLGLAISQRLVDLMGGRIWAASEPGRGSTFRFSVPLHAIAAPPRRAQARPDEPKRRTRVPAGGRILLVDDSDLNRLVIGDMLDGVGAAVDTATNGAEAVDKFGQGEYDMVFLDIQMPVMDGFAAARAMRALEEAAGGNRPRTPIVALSATALKDDRDTALAAGCDEYVVKPLRNEALMGLLKAYLPDAAAPARAAVLPSKANRPAAAQAGAVVFEPELAPLLPSFFRHLDQELDGVRRAVAAPEPAAVYRLAHTAKGNAMLFGFTDLVEALRLLEAAARDAGEEDDAVVPTSDAEEVKADLMRHLQVVEAEVADLRHRLGSHLPETELVREPRA